ncbi:MAG TPA: hypothetical protein VIM84_03450 [Gemmatimonadales bacterium]
MSSDSLTTYLNDHLAGSVVALELLDHLLQDRRNDGGELTRVRAEIEQDQQTLRQILADVGGKESPVRKAAAWLSEKLGQAKLRWDAREHVELRSLETLEALALGIQGKAALWRALAAIAGSVPALRKFDFSRLEQRAAGQFDRVDAIRLRTATAALTLRETNG